VDAVAVVRDESPWPEASAKAHEGKVVRPSIPAWMKEKRDFPSLRVDSCQIRAFMQIATVACQRQIIDTIGAAVLLRHDVLHMVLQVAMFLVQATIFAPLAGPPLDEVPRRRIHRLLYR
jgi:hypothetical protein